jgi:hypothetical protein
VSKAALAVVALLALVGLAALLFVSRRIEPVQPTTAPAASPQSARPDAALAATAPDAPQVSQAELQAAPVEAPAQEARASVAPSERLRVAVVGPAGEPLSSARLAWTALLPSFDLASWRAQDWAEIERSTARGEAGEDGRVTLEHPRLAAARGELAPSVLWVALDGFAIAPLLLPGDPKAWPAEARVQLAPEPSVEALVLDPDGHPAPGAQVDLYGTLRPTDAEAVDPALHLAVRVLHFTAETGADGVARLPRPRWNSAFVAAKDALQSAPWTGIPSGRIELRLAETFTLRGSVLLQPGATLEPESYVAAGGLVEGGYRWLGRLHVREDATFGPERFPIVDAAKYWFGLLGGNLLSSCQLVPTPRPGDAIDLTFDGKPALPYEVHVIDDAGADVPGAIARLSWAGESFPDEIGSPETITDEHGIASVPCCAAGDVYVTVDKRGFAPLYEGPVRVEEEAERSLLLVLQRLGRIEGRVVHRGEPVTEFEVVSWTTNPMKMVPRRFRDAADGRFTIDELPAVPTTLFASSSEFARSEPATLRFEDGLAEVVLELPDALSGRGRVVDADSREPVVTADVQVYTNYDLQLLTPVGERVPVGPDGSFEVRGLPPGRGSILVRAPGYALGLGFAVGAAGGETDFGVVAIHRGLDVVYRLVSAEPVDFAEYRLQCYGMQNIEAPEPFGEDGLFRIEGCVPGSLDLLLWHPDGSLTRFLRYFQAGEDWEVVHELHTGALALELVPSEDCKPGPTFEVYAFYREGLGGRRVFSFADTLEPALSGLPSGPVDLEIWSGDRALARRSVVVVVGDPERVERIPLTCESRTIRIVDHEDLPVVAATVSVACPVRPSDFVELGRSDADGKLVFQELGCDPILLNVLGRSLHYGIRVELDADPSSIQSVRLGPDASVAVRLQDGDEPLAGVACWLREPASTFMVPIATTNAQGIAVWERLRKTTYELDVGGKGLWRTRSLVPAFEGSGQATEVQVRRLGSIELTVRNEAGLPVGGLPIELRSKEFGEDVSSWIAAGRVPSPPQGLATDAAGKLLVAGIPRGDYLWSAGGAEESAIVGSASVPPGEVVPVAVIAP